MAVKWKTSQYPGVRFYEHDSRKHGVQKDRYFAIRHRVDGKRVEEGLGWASQGWSVQKAAEHLAELKKAQRTGEGEKTLAEKRQKSERERRRAEEAAKEEEARKQRESLTFQQFFDQEYLPAVQGVRKPDSIRKAREHVRNWLGPVLGNVPLLKITASHLEKVRVSLVKAGRSPRSQQYVMATFRAVWNKARNRGLVLADSPTKAVELPRVSNTRQRYLKPFEAEALLEALKARSFQTYQIALLSLHLGLRFGECCALVWGCIDLDKGVVHVLNAKGDKDRTVCMTSDVHAMFQGMPKGRHNELVFVSRAGGRIYHVSKSFDLAVADLGLNAHVTDPKHRFTFHGLRHTHASWLIESGVNLYVVQKQLGHSTPTVTQRYAHVGDAMLQDATRAFEANLQKPKSSKVVNLRQK